MNWNNVSKSNPISITTKGKKSKEEKKNMKLKRSNEHNKKLFLQDSDNLEAQLPSGDYDNNIRKEEKKSNEIFSEIIDDENIRENIQENNVICEEYEEYNDSYFEMETLP
jgi:hypothetical protein